MTAAEGDERVIATAQQIVRSLATTDTMTKDMFKILSNFDHRFSSMTDCAGGSVRGRNASFRDRLDSAQATLLRWDALDLPESTTASPSPSPSPSASQPRMIWEAHPEESAAYLQAVDDIIKIVNTLDAEEEEFQNEQELAASKPPRVTCDDGDDEVDSEEDNEDGTRATLLARAQGVLHKAMERLEEEFHNILVQQSEIFEPDRLYQLVKGPFSRKVSSFRSVHDQDLQDPSSPMTVATRRTRSEPKTDSADAEAEQQEEDVVIDLIRPEVIPDLIDIARRMVAARYQSECCKVYSAVRREVLEEGLHRLGIESLSIEEIQKMEWEVLETKIKHRTPAMKIAVRVLFVSEKRLCEQVFCEFGDFMDDCFVETAKPAFMHILNFCYAVAVSQRSSEKLFKTLDLYECLSELVPDINTVFSAEVCESIRVDSSGVVERLGEAVKAIFVEFENAIRNDPAKTPIPGGAFHPSTRYVMNYLLLFCSYTDTAKPYIEQIKGKDISDGSRSSLAQWFLSITSHLEANLDKKAKLYKDPALAYIFLMNNVHYMVRKVKQSPELRAFLGDDWIRKHSGQVRQYATSYQRAAWNKVLQCLRDEGISGGSGGGGSGSGSYSTKISKDALKERFRSFNAAFEDLYKNQTAWNVPYAQLREELRISIAEKLLPAYRSFLGRFGIYLESLKHVDKYIKYSPEDLEENLLHLFEGSPASMHNLRRKQSS